MSDFFDLTFINQINLCLNSIDNFITNKSNNHCLILLYSSIKSILEVIRDDISLLYSNNLTVHSLPITNIESQWSLLYDLILVTSYSLYHSSTINSNSSSSSFFSKSFQFLYLNSNKEIITRSDPNSSSSKFRDINIDILFLLSPYWAIVSLFTFPHIITNEVIHLLEELKIKSSLEKFQANYHPIYPNFYSSTDSSISELFNLAINIFSLIFIFPNYLKSLKLFLDDVYRHMNLIQSKIIKNSNNYLYYTRIKKNIKIKFKSFLHYFLSYIFIIHNNIFNKLILYYSNNNNNNSNNISIVNKKNRNKFFSIINYNSTYNSKNSSLSNSSPRQNCYPSIINLLFYIDYVQINTLKLLHYIFTICPSIGITGLLPDAQILSSTPDSSVFSSSTSSTLLEITPSSLSTHDTCTLTPIHLVTSFRWGVTNPSNEDQSNSTSSSSNENLTSLHEFVINFELTEEEYYYLKNGNKSLNWKGEEYLPSFASLFFGDLSSTTSSSSFSSTYVLSIQTNGCFSLALCKLFTLFCPAAFYQLTNKGQLPSHLLFKRGHEEVIKYFLSNYQETLLLYNNENKLPLHYLLLNFNHHPSSLLFSYINLFPSILLPNKEKENFELVSTFLSQLILEYIDCNETKNNSNEQSSKHPYFTSLSALNSFLQNVNNIKNTKVLSSFAPIDYIYGNLPIEINEKTLLILINYIKLKKNNFLLSIPSLISYPSSNLLNDPVICIYNKLFEEYCDSIINKYDSLLSRKSNNKVLSFKKKICIRGEAEKNEDNLVSKVNNTSSISASYSSASSSLTSSTALLSNSSISSRLSAFSSDKSRNNLLLLLDAAGLQEN